MWIIIRKINSGEIQFGDLSDEEKEVLLKKVFRFSRRYMLLSRIYMMRDVIKVIALIIIGLLTVDIVIKLFINP